MVNDEWMSEDWIPTFAGTSFVFDILWLENKFVFRMLLFEVFWS